MTRTAFASPTSTGEDFPEVDPVAPAFFTPVATRFRSYGVMLSDFGDTGAAGQYAERLLETPDFLEWERAALG